MDIKVKNDITVRKCTAEDLPLLSDIGERTFRETFAHCNTESDMAAYISEAFAEERLCAELSVTGSAFYVAEAGGKPAAYMKINTGDAQTESDRSGWLEVQRLYVLAEYKRRHIGSALMRVAISEAEKINAHGVWLGVWEHNHKAMAFYESFGFTVVGSHDFVLGTDRQTDLIMELSFDRSGGA